MNTRIMAVAALGWCVIARGEPAATVEVGLAEAAAVESAAAAAQRKSRPVDVPVEELDAAIARGRAFLVGAQNADGSFGSAGRTKDLNIMAGVGSHLGFRAATTALAVQALIEEDDGSSGVAAAIDRVNGENMDRARQWPEASLAAIVVATEPPPTQQAGLVLPPPPLATASEMAELLKQQGFAHIAVHYWPETLEEKGLWQISAEPRAFRQSQIEATGQALRPWLALVRKQRIAATDHIHLTLSYQREPVLYAQVQAA